MTREPPKKASNADLQVCVRRDKCKAKAAPMAESAIQTVWQVLNGRMFRETATITTQTVTWPQVCDAG